MEMNKQKWTELLIFIVAAELVGVLSGIVAGNTNSFYQELAKPPLSPPGWVFPMVWAVLYALMGWSAYLIAAAKVSTSEKGCALFLYGLQLLVNFMWSIVFFRLEKLGGSVAVILVLLGLLIGMLLLFRKIRPLAAWLNLPYLCWTAFASYLNIGIWMLNR